MPYTVQLSRRSRRFVEKADRKLQARLRRAFERIAVDPHHHPNIKSLRGELAGLWRYRLGDYRIVYEIRDDQTIVVILVIAKRGDVYDR